MTQNIIDICFVSCIISLPKNFIICSITLLVTLCIPKMQNIKLNSLNQVEMKGLTGKIKFDQHGLRTDFELEIVELKKDGLVKVGTWNENTGVNFTRNFTESYSEIVESLQNKTLIVTTIYVSFPNYYILII